MGAINNSRFDDEPRLDADSKPVAIEVTDGDIEILRLLNRYHYLPINYIAAFTGRSTRALRNRLDLLSRKPNKYLNRPAQFRDQPKEMYRFLDYELAEKGDMLLKDRGLFSDEPRFGDTKLYAHSRMICETICNLEMGARTARAQMVWWLDIVGNIPFEPHRFIPVKISHDFKTGFQSGEFEYYNDSNGPFGVEYQDGTARFFSLEAEHTTQTDAPNLKKTSFLKKFLAMQYIHQNRLYQTAWDIPNLIHLVVCQSQARIDTRKKLILELTGNKGTTYVAFALAPVIDDPDAKLVPDPDLFNRPWQRAGHPDLNLNQPTAKKAAA